MTGQSPREGTDGVVGASSGPARGESGGAHGGRHLRRTRGRRGLKLTAIVLASVLVAAVAFVAVVVLRLQSNVLTLPLNLGQTQESSLPVDSSTDPLQLLVLGTDTRTGNDGRFFGGEDLSSGQGNSDVMMLVTLSADRENVTVVSFPRDLLVPLPRCVDPMTGDVSRAVELGQLNGALKEGGPGCTVAAINDLTGLSIDHFMMADFNAVKELSSTLGGVEVCVEEAVDDEYSGLTLPAGTSEVEGEQALAFLRTRYSFGDGGDAGRIAAQQSFLASMARKVRAEGTLTNLPRLYSIADVVTRNLTVNEELSRPSELLKIADRLKDVDLGNIAFVTVPTRPWVEDPNRLVLDEAPAERLFEALRQDRGLSEPTPSPTSGTDSASAAPSSTSSTGSAAPTGSAQAPSIDPSVIQVLVLNATDDADRGREVQELLIEAGYTGAVPLQAQPQEETQILFGTGFDDAAALLAERFGVPASQVLYSPTANGLELVVGTDLATGTSVDQPPLESVLDGQTAEQETCQATSGF
ncbi:LytR family transcriptional regulator [Arthrobacter echini]|uniref:LytR family transcriptional regulator n=1 Tax=Arthrobacter echini TaxID=1529066 RepID=A0A4S5E6L4_9MICC|nr:LCP family protein [Arthrobacter echini]THJ67100.1 LytR family transcriptional regulator [Arthrobacter echini]